MSSPSPRSNPKWRELKAGQLVVSDYLRNKAGDFLAFPFAPCADDRTKCAPHLGGDLSAEICFPAGELDGKAPAFDSLPVGSVYYCGSAWGPRRVRVLEVRPGYLRGEFHCANNRWLPHVVTSQKEFAIGFEGMAEPMPDSPRPIWPKDYPPARIS